MSDTAVMIQAESSELSIEWITLFLRERIHSLCLF